MHESEKGKKSLSRVRLFTTPWTAAYQAPPSMGFSRQEYWSGVPLPSPSIILTSHRTHLEAGPGLQWKTFSWIHQCSCSKDRTWFQCFYPRAWPLKWSKEIPGSFWPPYHHVIWMCSFLGLWLTACRIFVLQPGTEPRPVDAKAQSLIHWTAREFPLNVFWVTLS